MTAHTISIFKPLSNGDYRRSYMTVWVPETNDVAKVTEVVMAQVRAYQTGTFHLDRKRRYDWQVDIPGVLEDLGLLTPA